MGNKSNPDAIYLIQNVSVITDKAVACFNAWPESEAPHGELN